MAESPLILASSPVYVSFEIDLPDSPSVYISESPIDEDGYELSPQYAYPEALLPVESELPTKRPAPIITTPYATTSAEKFKEKSKLVNLQPINMDQVMASENSLKAKAQAKAQAAFERREGVSSENEENAEFSESTESMHLTPLPMAWSSWLRSEDIICYFRADMMFEVSLRKMKQAREESRAMRDNFNKGAEAPDSEASSLELPSPAFANEEGHEWHAFLNETSPMSESLDADHEFDLALPELSEEARVLAQANEEGTSSPVTPWPHASN